MDHETGAFTNSGAGDVTGNVIPVDINLTPPRASTSGCEAADFAGLNFSGPNDIALIQRGTCTFAVKATNAQRRAPRPSSSSTRRTPPTASL